MGDCKFANDLSINNSWSFPLSEDCIFCPIMTAHSVWSWPLVPSERDRWFHLIVTDFGTFSSIVGYINGICVHDRGNSSNSLEFLNFIRHNRFLLPVQEDAMPTRRIPMKKIIEVLRLKHEAKLSHEKIARACGLSKGVVSKYISLTAAQDIGWSGLMEPDIE